MESVCFIAHHWGETESTKDVLLSYSNSVNLNLGAASCETKLCGDPGFLVNTLFLLVVIDSVNDRHAFVLWSNQLVVYFLLPSCH